MENESKLENFYRKLLYEYNKLEGEYKPDSFEIYLCDALAGMTKAFDDQLEISLKYEDWNIKSEAENRSLIDQINTLEYEKAQHISTIIQLQQDVMDLEMKFGAIDSDLHHVTSIKDKAFELLTRIGNGQVPQAELWQKINDLVNLPF